jgi:hypothetical protein
MAVLSEAWRGHGGDLQRCSFAAQGGVCGARFLHIRAFLRHLSESDCTSVK